MDQEFLQMTAKKSGFIGFGPTAHAINRKRIYITTNG